MYEYGTGTSGGRNTRKINQSFPLLPAVHVAMVVMLQRAVMLLEAMRVLKDGILPSENQHLVSIMAPAFQVLYRIPTA